MSQGTLYTLPTFRSKCIIALIEYYKVDVKTQNAHQAEEFNTLFPLKKTPAFHGPEDFNLTETIAILSYVLHSILKTGYVSSLLFIILCFPPVTSLIEDDKTKSRLLGTTNQQKAAILKWMCFANGDLVNDVVAFIRNIKGKDAESKEICDNAVIAFNRNADVFEKALTKNAYLEGDEVTLADILGTAAFAFPFSNIADAEWRKAHPAITKWFTTMTTTGPLASIYSDYKVVEKRPEFTLE